MEPSLLWMIEISREGLGIPFRVNLFKLRSIFRSSDICIIAIILFLPRTGVESTGKCFPESCIVFCNCLVHVQPLSFSHLFSFPLFLPSFKSSTLSLARSFSYPQRSNITQRVILDKNNHPHTADTKS